MARTPLHELISRYYWTARATEDNMAKRRNNPMCKVADAVSVDMQTGEETPIEGGGLMLLPAAPGTCQWCATKHEPELPHNKDSLYYQIKFKAIKGRYPTWTDAMEHCTEEMKALCKHELVRMLGRKGMPIPEDLQ